MIAIERIKNTQLASLQKKFKPLEGVGHVYRHTGGTNYQSLGYF